MSLTAPDRAGLADLLAGYVLGLDVGDVDAVVDLFTPDGEFRVYGRAFAGHDGLRGMFTAAPGGLHQLGAWTARPVEQGFAVRSQLVFFPSDRSEHRLAVYDDEVVRTPEGLRYAVRECRFLNREGVLGPRP